MNEQEKTEAPDSTAQISELTLAHYAQRAEAFRDGTQDHDVSQNIDALLKHLAAEPSVSPFVSPPASPSYRILDFGCGPGRDLQAFAALGHQPVGLDGTEEFVRMAREQTQCDVWHQDFLTLNLPAQHFDGIFANASLFHVPSKELPRVLRELHATLKQHGVLFASNPRGNDEEGWNRGRYGAYHTLESWQRFMTEAGFVELEHYYRPAGLPRDQQPWLASVWRKT